MKLSKSFSGESSPALSIATKATVERLTALRAKPAPQQHFRPRYVPHAELNSQMDKVNELSLADQITRLTAAKLQLKNDRMKAMSKGRAKAGFAQKTNGLNDGQER